MSKRHTRAHMLVEFCLSRSRQVIVNDHPCGNVETMFFTLDIALRLHFSLSNSTIYFPLVRSFFLSILIGSSQQVSCLSNKSLIEKRLCVRTDDNKC